ncbi:hypothetical protein Trydic_g12636 [Trypoxylus dichotomus]
MTTVVFVGVAAHDPCATSDPYRYLRRISPWPSPMSTKFRIVYLLVESVEDKSEGEEERIRSERVDDRSNREADTSQRSGRN